MVKNTLVSGLMVALLLVYGIVLVQWLPDAGILWVTALGIPVLAGSAGAFLMVGSRISRLAWTAAAPTIGGILLLIRASQQSPDAEARSFASAYAMYWIVSSAIVFLVVDAMRKANRGD